ncbi:MAG: DUF2931 family protein [Gammaproteobacteria bacterium]|nr:DUF2931 family protein [Gammaproteobacteria bacterium]
MKAFSRSLIFICVVLLTHTACTRAEDEKLHYFSIGYSTPEGNKIWIRKAEFDRRYTRPGGNLACCWEEEGASSGIFNESLPKHVYIEWIDLGDQLLYTADVDLVADVQKRAKEMTEVRDTESGFHEKGNIIIIVGMGEHGEVIVWLSNYPYSGGTITGRVLDVVGKAQATARPWKPPAAQ